MVNNNVLIIHFITSMQGHLSRRDQFYVIILKVINLVSGLCLANFC